MRPEDSFKISSEKQLRVRMKAALISGGVPIISREVWPRRQSSHPALSSLAPAAGSSVDLLCYAIGDLTVEDERASYSYG